MDRDIANGEGVLEAPVFGVDAQDGDALQGRDILHLQLREFT